jgi:hypothetical protein
VHRNPDERPSAKPGEASAKAGRSELDDERSLEPRVEATDEVSAAQGSMRAPRSRRRGGGSRARRRSSCKRGEPSAQAKSWSFVATSAAFDRASEALAILPGRLFRDGADFLDRHRRHDPDLAELASPVLDGDQWHFTSGASGAKSHCVRSNESYCVRFVVSADSISPRVWPSLFAAVPPGAATQANLA